MFLQPSLEISFLQNDFVHLANICLSNLEGNFSPKPSPRPRMTLVIMSNGIECARSGVITVLIDQSSTATISTVLHPKRLAVLAPMICKSPIPSSTPNHQKTHRAFSNRYNNTHLTGEVAKSKGGQDPSLPVEIPLELIGHRNYGDGHYDSVGSVDEVRRGAESHDPRGTRQHGQSRHFCT